MKKTSKNQPKYLPKPSQKSSQIDPFGDLLGTFLRFRSWLRSWSPLLSILGALGELFYLTFRSFGRHYFELFFDDFLMRFWWDLGSLWRALLARSGYFFTLFCHFSLKSDFLE